jgi:ATP-binding cassette subfamily B protein
MYPAAWAAEVRGSVVWVTAILAFTVADALAYGMGGGLFRAQAISLGTVYMVIAYAALLARPIEMIRNQLQNLQRADASISRVQDLLATRSTLMDGPDLLPPGALSVALDAVSFRYDDDDYALTDVSVTLAPGQRLGIVGRTGSGKSTVARLLARQHDPQQGCVRLGGVDLRQAQLRGLRARIGLVTQAVQLFDASLRANITFFDPAIADDRLMAVLAEVGLGPWLAQLPQGLDTPVSAASLSAGEAQLLALARVFLRDPGLVILDEASSRLDPATEAFVDVALQRLLAGRTAVIIAHRLATLEHVDHILMLAEGRVLEYGGRAELAADPTSHFGRLRQQELEAVLR